MRGLVTNVSLAGVFAFASLQVAAAQATPSAAPPAVSDSPIPVKSLAPSVDEPSGSIYVTSLPSGADLWIDGVHLGRTPMLLGALYGGRHTMTLAKSGWVAHDTTFRIVPNTIALRNYSLTRLKTVNPNAEGSVVFHNVAQARVLIDGVAVADLTQPHGLIAGRHVIEVEAGTTRFQREFEVFPDMTTDLVLRDAPLARAPSVVAAVDSVIPLSAITVQHTKIIIRYRGHIAVGHLGDTTIRIDKQLIHIDPAPIMLGGRLYLPVDVIAVFTTPA